MPIPAADERPVLRAVLMRVRRDTPTADTAMLCSALESRLDAEQSAERPPPNTAHQVTHLQTVRLVPPAGVEMRPVGQSTAERVRRHRERKRLEAAEALKQG